MGCVSTSVAAWPDDWLVNARAKDASDRAIARQGLADGFMESGGVGNGCRVTCEV